jgi:DNA-binding CsgD family transcriptional regulator/tetratricopeptide (TPR) repeat protein
MKNLQNLYSKLRIARSDKERYEYLCALSTAYLQDFQKRNIMPSQEKALEYAQRAITIYPLSAHAHALLLESYLYAYQYKQAAEYINHNPITDNHQSDDPWLPHVFLHAGEIYIHLGDLQQSGKFLYQAKQILNKDKDIQPYIHLLCLLSQYHGELQEFDKALEYAQTALPLAIANSMPKHRAWALMNIGQAYRYMGNTSAAILTLEQVLEISDTLSDPAGAKISIYLNLGGICIEMGEYTLGLDYLQKGLELARQHHSQRKIAAILSNIADILCLRKEYMHAMEYYEECMLLPEQENLGTIWIHICKGAANAAWHIGNYARSSELYQQALRLASAQRLWSMMLACSAGLAQSHYSAGDAKTAIEILEQAHLYLEHTQPNSEQAIYYTVWANILMDQKDFMQALSYLDKALGCTFDASYQDLHVQIYQSRTICLQSIGNLALALENEKELGLLLLKEILKADHGKNSLLLAEIDRARYQEQIKKLHEQAEKQHLLLESASQEISHLADTIVWKSQIIHGIPQIIDNQNLSPQEKLNLLYQQYTDLVNAQLAQKEKQQNMPLWRATLMIKLSHLCPALSRNECQICILLSIGLNTKQIAAILNLSAAHIDNARSIIRHKLNIKPHIDLQQALDKIRRQAMQVQSNTLDAGQRIHTLWPQLTPRETEICMYLLQNYQSSDIAEVLGLSIRTVNNHRRLMRDKMNIPSGQDLAFFIQKSVLNES